VIAVFLVVTALVAVLAGVVSLVAGSMPRAAWHRRAPHAAVGSR
jgi:hypothetical protein